MSLRCAHHVIRFTTRLLRYLLLLRVEINEIKAKESNNNISHSHLGTVIILYSRHEQISVHLSMSSLPYRGSNEKIYDMATSEWFKIKTIMVVLFYPDCYYVCQE